MYSIGKMKPDFDLRRPSDSIFGTSIFTGAHLYG